MNKLILVETRTEFYHLYVVEAEDLDSAKTKAENIINSTDPVEEVGQKFLGESIVHAQETGLELVKELYFALNNTDVLMDSYLNEHLINR